METDHVIIILLALVTIVSVFAIMSDNPTGAYFVETTGVPYTNEAPNFRVRGTIDLGTGSGSVHYVAPQRVIRQDRTFSTVGPLRGTIDLGTTHTRNTNPQLKDPEMVGIAFSEETAQACTWEMQWRDRMYNRYIACCSAECHTRCANVTSGRSASSCTSACSRSCESIMTNNYLSLPVGTWR